VAVSALAAAAERIREVGDFSALDVSPPIRDWLTG
jgi:hypothetical protein